MNQGDKTILRHIRHIASAESIKGFYDKRIDQALPTHVSPGSTLIAAIGQHWHPESFEAVEEMALTTAKAGYDICFYEEHDRCYHRFDAIGLMRNMAYMKAIREGWEYLLYVENDVIPKPDALIQLLKHPELPVVSPIIRYADGDSHGQTLPEFKDNSGVFMITSCVTSFLLFQTAVFLPWALGGFWESVIGADELYYFTKMAQTGIRPFIDTSVEVIVLEGPHYPLDNKGSL